LNDEGTFDSQEQAALANEIGRKNLFCVGIFDAEIDDIDEKVKLAREAAQNAVSRLHGIPCSTPVKAGNTTEETKTREKNKAESGEATTKSKTNGNQSPAPYSLMRPEASGSVISGASATVSCNKEPESDAHVDVNSKAAIDFRNVGVRQTRSGNWVRYRSFPIPFTLAVVSLMIHVLTFVTICLAGGWLPL
jgi:cobalamin biosynthesis Mg chelatase CobN